MIDSFSNQLPARVALSGDVVRHKDDQVLLFPFSVSIPNSVTHPSSFVPQWLNVLNILMHPLMFAFCLVPKSYA